MGTFYSPSVVTDGLILALDAANPKSYPGSGTIWNDLSGNGNNGTLTNGPTFDSGNGGSISFDGSNDYIIGNTPSELNVSEPCSINVWIYYNSFNNPNPRIIEVKDATNSIQILRSATGLFATKNDSFQLNTVSTTWVTPSTGIWYNVVAVWNPSISNTDLYINGVSQTPSDSYPLGVGNQSNKYTIGVRTDLIGTTFTNGNISQVQVYNRALTPEEVLQNYNATKSRYNL